MKQYSKTYKVIGHNGDGISFYMVKEIVGGMETFVKGVSRNKQEMIDLAEKLNSELTTE